MLKSKLNNISDNNKKSQLKNKLIEIENKVNKVANQDKPAIKKLEQEIKEVKQELEGNDKPNNKEGGEFIYFELSDGYHIFENASLGQRGQSQTAIKISENHPQTKHLLNEGKLQDGKQFTIRYGKIDKKPESGLLIFNENNQELEIIEVKNPSPDPSQNKVISYVVTKINDNTFKYHFLIGDGSGEKLTWKSILGFLEVKYRTFFQEFQGALKDANSKFPNYFWKCPPVSKKTLDKPFEFVVIRSNSLNNMTENSGDFAEYLAENNYINKPAFVSFPNKPGSGKPSDAILVIPSYIDRKDQKHYDFKNISTFTKNASEEQQQEFWKGVADNLMKELEKGDALRWLNTEGTGVHYLHVRIDEKPKYYGNYPEYEKWE